jgi:imidazolonepropionase-like amidohydrolase
MLVIQLSAVSAGTLAIVNVSVGPMTTARVWSAQTVLIREGRIAQIGPLKKVLVPTGATRVDGTGKYLIPELVDAHVHFQPDEAANQAFLKLFVIVRAVLA